MLCKRSASTRFLTASLVCCVLASQGARAKAPERQVFDLVTAGDLHAWAQPAARSQTWQPRGLFSSGGAGPTSCHGAAPPAAGGPRIDILQPALGKPLHDPINISVAFVPANDAPIQPTAFRVCYVAMLATVDITQRVTDHAAVTSQGLRVTGAKLPPGHHHLFMLIADQSGRVGRRDVIFDIE